MTPIAFSRLCGILCLLVGASTAAPAAELRLDGNRLLVMGMLDGSATAAFAEQLASTKVRTVVFEDAFGGNADVARSYAEAIRTSGVQTEVRGQCHAACAYAFLAGQSHRFGRGGQINGLLIPMATRPKQEELASRWRGEGAQRTLAEFNSTPGAPGAVDASASSTTTVPQDSWRPEQGVLFTSSPTLFGRIYNTFYCDGTQGRDFTKCELLSDADPYLLGVLTP
jgi:hypothetical protein